VAPYARKVDSDLFEMRVRRGRHIRIFYFYHQGELVFGVHAFVKKSRKAPKQELRQAKRVRQLIRRGEYDE